VAAHPRSDHAFFLRKDESDGLAVFTVVQIPSPSPVTVERKAMGNPVAGQDGDNAKVTCCAESAALTPRS